MSKKYSLISKTAAARKSLTGEKQSNKSNTNFEAQKLTRKMCARAMQVLQSNNKIRSSP
jgi:hypothetical protein